MGEPRKDLGENDVNFADTISNVAEKVVADSISHAQPADDVRKRTRKG